MRIPPKLRQASGRAAEPIDYGSILAQAGREFENRPVARNRARYNECSGGCRERGLKSQKTAESSRVLLTMGRWKGMVN
jgi:hypothetical protein